MLNRKRIAIWAGAGCLLLVSLGYLQFRWIGQVNESQRLVARNALNRSLRLFLDKLRYETGLFLTTFRWDIDLDRPSRLAVYTRRHLLWHEVSAHGPLVKRILFYDTRPSEIGDLTEYIGESRTIRAVPWGDELDPLRRHIDGYAMPYGSVRTARWAATWMYHPQSRALYRPIMRWDPSSPSSLNSFVVQGYLIVQVDLDYVRDRLFPDLLDDSFRGMEGSADYSLTIAVNGSPAFHYEPSRTVAGEAASSAGPVTRYELVSPPDPAGLAPPDRISRLPLSDAPVPNPVLRVGGIQRVNLRNLTDIARLGHRADLQVGPLAGLGWVGPENRAVSSGVPPEQIIAPTRLFVTGDRPHQVTVEARHLGIALEAAMNSEYRRSLALGMAILALLVGAMAAVAVSAWNAARLNELRMEAAASQAHELRTPVAGISALADNMVGGMLGTGNRIIEYGELIRGLARRLGEHADRMVEESSVRSIKQRYSPSMLDVSSVAKDVVDRARPMIAGAGFESECSLAEGLPMVRVDEQVLRKSLGDLLSNAVKYGEPGRWVKVETAEGNSSSDREVQIRVHDHGPGVPPQEASKIFEPYYRMARDASSPVPGSGLGLKLVRDRVELMGGRVTLESKQGRGSVFTIHIPVDA